MNLKTLDRQPAKSADSEQPSRDDARPRSGSGSFLVRLRRESDGTQTVTRIFARDLLTGREVNLADLEALPSWLDRAIE